MAGRKRWAKACYVGMTVRTLVWLKNSGVSIVTDKRQLGVQVGGPQCATMVFPEQIISHVGDLTAVPMSCLVTVLTAF